MKIEMLSENKLKLFLSRRDLSSYGITYETMNYEELETKKAFKDMLNKAKAATGMSFETCKLLVEARPTGSFGCILTVTKEDAYPSTYNSEKVYAFVDVDDFLDFIENAKEEAKNCVFSLLDDTYYAIVNSSERLHTLPEFAKMCNSSTSELVKHHGKVLKLDILP